MFLYRFINTDEECMHKNQTEIINLKSREAWIYYVKSNAINPQCKIFVLMQGKDI